MGTAEPTACHRQPRAADKSSTQGGIIVGLIRPAVEPAQWAYPRYGRPAGEIRGFFQRLLTTLQRFR